MLNLLLQIIVTLVIVGVLLWALEQFPMDATIAKIIKVVVVVAAVIYAVHILLAMTGHAVLHG